MKWHIIRWNPKKEEWGGIQKDIDSFSISGKLEKDWEFAGSNSIQEGNGFFLLRQRIDPRGVMGWGKIKSIRLVNPYRTCCRLEFDMLHNPEKREMLTREYLKYLFPYVHWDTPKTGSCIDDETASLVIEEYNHCVKTIYK